jgi:hypothetical protein
MSIDSGPISIDHATHTSRLAVTFSSEIAARRLLE